MLDSVTVFICTACAEFECSNGECIAGSLKCNNWNDCGDGSDEFGCGKIPVPVSISSFVNIMHKCIKENDNVKHEAIGI